MRKFFVLIYALVTLLVGACTTVNLPIPEVEPPPAYERAESLGTIGISKQGTTLTVLYSSVSYPEDAWRIERMVEAFDCDELILEMFNGGGNPFVMLDLVGTIERLRESGVYITTRARGYIASAAVPIYVMGDTRIIYPDTMVMIHPGGWKGNEWRIPKSYMKVFEFIEVRYAEIVSSRTKITFGDMLKYLNYLGTELDEDGNVLDSETGARWFTDKEALEMGIATEIGDD